MRFGRRSRWYRSRTTRRTLSIGTGWSSSPESMRRFKGPAVIFDSQEEIKRRDEVVETIRSMDMFVEGLRGRVVRWARVPAPQPIE